MNARLHVRLVLALLLCSAACSSSVFAQESDPAQKNLTAEQRWSIMRSVMSQPGVMLDMSNMTDNGYVWLNDALWEGEVIPANDKWYTAAFLFKRAGYKGVWLQYAIQLDERTGILNGFKRSYGSARFR